MMAHPILRTIGLMSVLCVACGDDGPGGASATDSGASATTDGTGASVGPTTTDGSASEGAPTTSGGSVGETDSGTTTTGDGTTTDVSGSSSTTDPTTGADDTSTGDVVPDTTTGETTDTTDGTTGEPPDEDCQAPGSQPPCDAGTMDVFKAIGLNCSDDKTSAIPIKNPVIMSPAANSYRVTTHYGTAKDPMDPALYAWGPKEGERLLVIGTGTFPNIGMDGGLTEPDSAFGENVDTANGNPDGLSDLPGVMTWEKGSNNGQGGTPFMDCDGVKDCSDTLDDQWNISPNNEANDVFYMSFDLETPLGTHGYLFDFAYFSQEWPTYVGDAFNDMFVVWSTSESFTGNVTFIDEQPLTVTALDPYMVVQPGDPLLAGTGFPDTFIDTEGAGTGWFTAKGSATPGETFTIAIAVFDLGDDILDTIGLIDKFRWDCEGCVPSEVDSCGIRPQ
jgi:hypothetical protein